MCEDAHLHAYCRFAPKRYVYLYKDAENGHLHTYVYTYLTPKTPPPVISSFEKAFHCFLKRLSVCKENCRQILV